jgi:hypothetical protein
LREDQGRWSNTPMEEMVAAAGAACGAPLSQPEQLPGGNRATVFRCRRGGGGTVVVKAYRDAPDARRAFAAEAAALAFGVAGPRLLGVDTEFPLVVMEDLGSAPSLADLLLGDDAQAAHTAMLTWARGLGRLAAETVGRQAEFASLRQRYGDPQAFLDRAWHEQRCGALADLLADAQVKAPAGLDDDLSQVLSVAEAGRYPVFSPGDICPDNNLLTGRGLQVFDFEGASYHSVFLDAAYTVMPFATCWCAFRLPPQIRDETEAAFRGEVVAPYPALCDDEVWRPGLRRAAALWTISMTTLMLATVGSEDRATHPARRPVPTMRQLLRYRWQWLVEQLEPTGDLPALAQALRGLLDATRHWNAPSMPVYPPWR